MADTVTQILDITERLISERGINAFSYRDISDEVGIKTASIHYHFPAKADLATAVVKRYREGMSAGLAEIEANTSSGLKRIEEYGKMLVRCFDGGKGFCLCVSLASDQTTLSDSTGREVKAFFEDSVKWIKEAIVCGQRDSEIAEDLHPEKTAISIVGAFEGTMLMARAYKDEKPLKDAIKWIKNVIS